jgi:hypothetical protein
MSGAIVRELRESPQPVEEGPERPEPRPYAPGRSGGCTEAVVVEEGICRCCRSWYSWGTTSTPCVPSCLIPSTNICLPLA